VGDELAWVGLGLTALGLELAGVRSERRGGNVAPLTRILRDRLFKRKGGIAFKLGFFTFWLWLGIHMAGVPGW
jgi:hypothetical protein